MSNCFYFFRKLVFSFPWENLKVSQMANPIYGGRVQTKQDWDFRIGLFECLNDKNLCLLGCFCPCYIGGMNKSEADGRPNHFCDCLCWLPSVEYYTRIQLRRKYDVLLNVEVEVLFFFPHLFLNFLTFLVVTMGTWCPCHFGLFTLCCLSTFCRN